MMHSFYTEIEKILKLIAREWDGKLPSSDSWHKELLVQMSQSTAGDRRCFQRTWSKFSASSWLSDTSFVALRSC